MSRTKALAAGYVALAVTDAVLAGRTGTAARRLRYLTKPALMPTLAAATGDRGGRGLRVAHAFSWGGDVALMARGDKAFQAGVASFLGAHLAYISTFLSRRGPVAARDTAALKAALGLWLTTAPAMSFAARRTDPALGGPVAAYSTALAAMFASSALLDANRSPGAARTVKTGAALFLASDTLLGLRQFVLHDERPELETAVMATYTAAQALIAVGTARL